MRKILIIDPDCQRTSGHNFQTTKSLISLIENAKFHVAVSRFAGTDVEFDNCDKVWRWPDTRPIAGRVFKLFKKSTLNQRIRIANDAKYIKKLIRRANLGPDDTVVLHSADNLLPALPTAIRLFCGPNEPHFCIRFLDAKSNKRTHSHYHEELAKLQRTMDNVSVYTETHEAGKYLMNNYEYKDLHDLILPLSVSIDSSSTKTYTKGNEFVVGFLGGKRRNQRPDRIPLIAQKLLRKMQIGPIKNVKFIIQAPGIHTKEIEIYNAAMDALKLLSSANADSRLRVELLPPNLSDAEFSDTIERCHALLLPYNVQAYNRRGSGLIIECVLSGTPVVVPAGFSMGRWLNFAGSPMCTTNDEFANAILNVEENFDFYSLNARLAGDQMRLHIIKRVAALHDGLAST